MLKNIEYQAALTAEFEKTQNAVYILELLKEVWKEVGPNSNALTPELMFRLRDYFDSSE